MFKKIITISLMCLMTLSLFANGTKDSSTGTGDKMEGPVELTWGRWAGAQNSAMLDRMIEVFEEENPEIKIISEFRPSGEEGENIIKTRIAAGDMPDLLTYNSGSLFQVLNPEKNFVNLSDETYSDKIIDSFKMTVGSGPEKFFGIPNQTIPVGGIIYNKAVYRKLGLSIPKTWLEFIKNCEAVKAAGLVPVAASYKDSWSAQLVLLQDYYYVQAANPDFADNYTSNKAKFATTPAALRGFEKLQELHEKDLISPHAATTSYEMAYTSLLNGEAAHYPMPTWLLSAMNDIDPNAMNDIGFFAQPGDDPSVNGVTIWMPNNISISNTSKNIDAAKKFLDFFISEKGVETYIEASGQIEGVFALKSVELPDNVFQAVKDANSYIDAGKSVPALEFLSSVKGPNLPQICVQAGLSLATPEECASQYDRDVEKQAKQLMLTGW